jgi:hypothetical protein
MNQPELRRYDIDWLRSIAIFLLMFYHSAIVFQPFAEYVGFVQSPDYLLGLWKAMEALNIWRIPLLFFVSGMGLYFSMNRRGLGALLLERSTRILVPLVFGSLVIVPLYLLILMQFKMARLVYIPFPGHLWFLLNICVYLLLFTWPLLKLRRWVSTLDATVVERWGKQPAALYLLMTPLLIESWVVNPEIYALFSGSWHGFWVGLVAFLSGFGFVLLGKPLWQNLDRLKYVHLIVALVMFAARSANQLPSLAISLEASAWLLAAFGFSYRYLSFNHRFLSYLNQSVFPVYIIHMVMLMGISYFVVFWEIPAELRFLIIFIGTLLLSFAFYEGIRRLKWVRPLFGMRY